MTSLSAPPSRRASPNPSKKFPVLDEPRSFVDIHRTPLPTLDPFQFSQYVPTTSQYFNDTTDFHHYHYKDADGAKLIRDHNGFTPDSIFYDPPSHDDIFDASSDSSSSVSSTGTGSSPTSGVSKNSIFDVPSLAPTIPFIRSARSRNSIFDTPPSTEPSLRPPLNPLKQKQANQQNEETAATRASSQRLLGADSKRSSLSPHVSVMDVDSPSGLAKKNAIFWDTAMTTAVTPPHTSRTISPSLEPLSSISSTPRSTIQSPSLIQLPFGNSASRTISPSSFSSPPAHLGPTTPPTLPDSSCPTLIPPQDISLVLLPTRKNLLGVGRHAQVYKATFTTPQYITPRVCAAKRLNPNKESQTLGLSEAYILRRLMGTGGQHQNIIQFIGVKDEASFQTPLHSAATASSTFSPQAITPVTSPMALGNVTASPAGTPNTPSSLDLPQDGQDSSPRLVLLLEYCANGSLWDWVQANKMKIGRRLWMKWARQLASAMERVHTVGLVHHDIKPHNVLLTEMLDVKLSDFGTAVFMQSMQPLQDGLGKGTPPYSPPELLVSPPYPYSSSVDIFSLGVTLFVIGITGEEPYQMIRSPIELLVWVRKGGYWEWEERLRTLAAKDSPPSRRDSMSGVVRYLNGEPVPQPILSLLKRMMAPRPEDRPTAVEVVEKLRLLDWGEEMPGLGGGEGFDWERKGDQSLFGAPDEEERQVDEMVAQAAGQKNGQSVGRA